MVRLPIFHGKSHLNRPIFPVSHGIFRVPASAAVAALAFAEVAAVPAEAVATAAAWVARRAACSAICGRWRIWSTHG